MKYEYVERNEYKGPLQLALNLIKNIHNELSHLFTFDHKLAGSGSRKLITRKVNSNDGFDFDFIFLLQKWQEGLNGLNIKNHIIDLINDYKSHYSTYRLKIENSTSAITLKFHKPNSTNVWFSIDFVICLENEYGLNILRLMNNKQDSTWNLLPNTEDFYLEKEKVVKEKYEWSYIKKKYLHLKNEDSNNNKSYQLYIQLINNLYNELD